MNASKPLIFAASLLIASAGIAGIRAYANASAGNVLPAAVGAKVQPIQTLPTIEVRPTPAQLEEISGQSGGGSASVHGSAALGGADFDMPYYSFAAKSVIGN